MELLDRLSYRLAALWGRHDPMRPAAGEHLKIRRSGEPDPSLERLASDLGMDYHDKARLRGNVRVIYPDRKPKS